MDALPALAAWTGALSLLDLALCIHDKRQARHGRARVPERTLLGLALLGGSPGLLLGMLLARHKTRKAAFLLPLALILVMQALALAWLVSGGAAA